MFDSSALISFLFGEAGAHTVEEALLEKDSVVYISAVDLGEVTYVVQQLSGDEAAVAVEAKVFETRKLHVVDATWLRVKQAERLRREWKLSLPASICAGLVEEKQATLVTKNREFQGLQEEVAILWL